MIDTGFEFQYIVKNKEIEEYTEDAIKWGSAIKKVITVKVSEKTREELHKSKTEARNIIIETLNNEYGVGEWRFFD